MKYNFGWNKNNYQTPPELYSMALEHFGVDVFDLDTCCSCFNIPARFHCIDGELNGLEESWLKYNWCNPPFNECKKWIIKAYKEQQEGSKTAMLIPVRTETAYWHQYILNNPNVYIKYLRKGYKFINPETKEPMGVFKNALALVYFE